MRALLVILGAMALLIGVATQPASAGKGTDIEQFIKRVGKFAIEGYSDQKPKGLCVCLDAGPLNAAGRLEYSGGLGDLTVNVYCWVSTYTPDGFAGINQRCDVFEVLSK